METTLFKIEFSDGRVFKVFCANKHQKDRFLRTTWDSDFTVEVLENGIHNINQWEKYIRAINDGVV
jgi:hypothetical protein